MAFLPTNTLGELLLPIARHYGMHLADLASLWGVDEEQAGWLLRRPSRDLDVELLTRIVIQTGMKPQDQPLWNNFVRYVARESRIELDDAASFQPNHARDPFQIELFLALFRCLTAAAQKKLVWTLVWANTAHPPWLAEIPEFLEQHRAWGEAIYWRWNELDFADLGPKYRPAEANARAALRKAGCGGEQLNYLLTSPAYLIFRSLFLTLEVWLAPPDDRRQILQRTVPGFDQGSPGAAVSPETFWRIILSPLWEADPEQLSVSERQAAEAVCGLLDLLKRYPYPPVRVPTAAALIEIGRDGAPGEAGISWH